METYKQEFIEFMVESDVLKFGDFTLKSGRKSPFFMNAGAYVTGEQLHRLGLYYAQRHPRRLRPGLRRGVRAGLQGHPAVGHHRHGTVGTLRQAGALLLATARRSRTTATRGILLGSALRDGDRVVIVEDVTTSGKSIEETHPILMSQADVEVVGLMVSLNRLEVGKGGEKCALDEVSERYGFPTASIVDMAEVTEHLHGRPCQGRVVIDDAVEAALDAYYAQYGAE